MKLVNLIQEGRYDAITGDAVKRVMKFIKDTRKKYDKGKPLGKLDKDGFYEDVIHTYDTPLDFYLSVRIKRDNIGKQQFKISAAEWFYKSADTSIVEVELTIDPDKEHKTYSTIVSYLKDRLRHEIEHVTQHGSNKKAERPRNTSAKIRNRLGDDPKNRYKYYILPDEIPALVHGMYAMAKNDKKPLDIIFDEQLYNDISHNNISKQDAVKIKKKWIEYAKKKLPSAVYSKKY
ncbi:MAG: hypothetical protein H8E98_03910 [Bacteroidetes bacterium]|nr:hypothetical protein [Bacteroidota bacterium]